MERPWTEQSAAEASDHCERLIAFIPSIYAIVCKQCGYVVPRDSLRRHLSTEGKHGIRGDTIRAVLKVVDTRHPRTAYSADPLFTRSFHPPLSHRPLPHLPILTTGYIKCSFPATNDPAVKANEKHTTCRFISINVEQMKAHCRKVHSWNRAKRHLDTLTGGSAAMVPPWKPVVCQRLRKCNQGSHPFEVKPPACASTIFTESKHSEDLVNHSTLEQRVELQLKLQAANDAHKRDSCRSEGSSNKSDRRFNSDWLNLTQWPDYLKGTTLASVARLTYLPSSATVSQSILGAHKEILSTTEHANNDKVVSIITPILTAFDDLIEETRSTLTSGRMNIFDQHRVNSFQQGKPFRRPIFTKLLNGTYRSYKRVGKQLLCYVMNVAYFRHRPHVSFKMTQAQVLALDHLVAACRSIPKTDSGRQDSDSKRAWAKLRRRCLDLWITLLDHNLKGSIYDSLIVGFLAAMGIDPKNNCFREPSTYTSVLSALVKMAQFLVAQRAVIGVDEGEADFPSELLDAMQDRFMVYGSRSPIEWALKLRAYGRGIQDRKTA